MGGVAATIGTCAERLDARSAQHVSAVPGARDFHYPLGTDRLDLVAAGLSACRRFIVVAGKIFTDWNMLAANAWTTGYEVVLSFLAASVVGVLGAAALHFYPRSAKDPAAGAGFRADHAADRDRARFSFCGSASDCFQRS